MANKRAPDRTTLTVAMTTALKARINKDAKRRRQSVSAYVCMAVEEHLEQAASGARFLKDPDAAKVISAMLTNSAFVAEIAKMLSKGDEGQRQQTINDLLAEYQKPPKP